MVNMPRYQRGVSFVLWAVALIPLMGFAVLAIDINRLFLASGELQHAADAGALAGVAKLPNTTVAKDVATAVAMQNKALGETVESLKAEVTPGCWGFNSSATGGSFTENCGSNPYDALRVITKRSSTPVEAIFGKIFHFDSYPVRAVAIGYRTPGLAQAPACVISLNGTLMLSGKGSEVFTWTTCTIFAVGELTFNGGGTLTTQGNYCTVSSSTTCNEGSWTVKPTSQKVDQELFPGDPWKELPKFFNPPKLIKDGGKCTKIYDSTSNNSKFSGGKLERGVHCIVGANSVVGTPVVNGKDGVLLYIDGASGLMELGSGSELIALGENYSDLDVTGVAIYGTGGFDLKGNTTLGVYGALYFPNGSFIQRGNSQLLNVVNDKNGLPLTQKCLQVVAKSVDMGGAGIGEFDFTDCAKNNPIYDPAIGEQRMTLVD